MAPSEASGYLPGDPRYGLSGDALRRYYGEKPAQWVTLFTLLIFAFGLRSDSFLPR